MTAPQPDSLRALVSVMDRLRSPGGCPWDAQQTHESLVPYVLEEAHELAEAIEAGDRPGLREELGEHLAWRLREVRERSGEQQVRDRGQAVLVGRGGYQRTGEGLRSDVHQGPHEVAGSG